jgi:uncharacterized membrane protein YfcA
MAHPLFGACRWEKQNALTVDFPISHTHINPVYLVITGFLVGVLGGFFGVGGSFLAGPVLFGFGVPMNFVVGTDLAHIVGKSVVAARKHYSLGHVDMKLGAFMMIGTIPGVELGAQLIEELKRWGHVDVAVGVAFIAILLSVSGFMAWETWKTTGRHPHASKKNQSVKKTEDHAFAHVSRWVQKIKLPPYIKLPKSDIAHISVWSIIGVSFVGGIFSGFLGGGAGYIRLPAMIYLLGVPTHVAVGTDLFEIIVSAGYGTVTHALKGNVDILIALVMHTGAAIGAQFGTVLTQYFSGTRLRIAFIPLPVIGCGIILWGLLRGVHGK